MKKASKRVLAVVLALVMMLSVLSVAAVAARPETVKQYPKYVSLGDSVGSGFGQPDYNKYGKMLCDEVLMKRIDGSYPDLVGDYVGSQGDDMTMLNIPGFTAAALRYELDDSFTMNEWETYELSNFTFGVYGADDLTAWRPLFRNAIANADLVTLDIGLNDTWYATIALVYYIADQGSLGPFDPRGTLEEELATYGTWGTVVRNAMYFVASWAENPLQWANFISLWIECMLPYFTIYAEHYEAIVTKIFELNPDVTVVAPGIVNPFKYMSFVPGYYDSTKVTLYTGGPTKVTLPFVGDIIVPDEVNIAPGLASVAGGIYDLAYTPSRKYYVNQYPGQYYYVDCSDAELMGKSWTIPLYENSTLDESGFNPHPTTAGHKYIAKQIVSVLPQDYTRPAKLTKGSEGWGVYNDDGTVDESYTGFGKGSKYTYYVKNGLMQSNYSGIVKLGSNKYYIKNGRWMNTYSGTITSKSKVYTIRNGVVVRTTNR